RGTMSLRSLMLTVSSLAALVTLGACGNGASCEPYAGNPGACHNFVGYTWNGRACVAQAGCLCEGDGCPGVYQDLPSCNRDHTVCSTDGATDSSLSQ
ncbi:MAG: hypothetical protein WCJ30_20200, partial [Deltaproteobacteria bacterium]